MSAPLLSRPDLYAIVLAAGGSSRLGRPKQLLRHRTETLLVRSARLARQACGRSVIVVLGADQLRMRRALRGRLRPLPTVTYNARWRQGLASSLGAGLSRLPARAKAALILLVDQPFIERADLGRLERAWRASPHRAVAARYAGRSGVPAIIPRAQFAAVRALRGDTGARQVLRQLETVVQVEMPAARFDVDTPEDAASFLERAVPESRN